MRRYVFHGEMPWCLLSCLVVVVLAATAAIADPIPYGSLVAQNIIFEDVEEEPATGNSPLFDTPTVGQNSLVFFPVSFSAASIGGDPTTDETSGTLSMTVASIGGAPIVSIRIWEMGDYSLAGNGTSVTTVARSTPIVVTIVEVNGGAVALPPLLASVVFNPHPAGTLNLIDDGGQGVAWTGEAVVDIVGALADQGIAGKATKVTLSLENTLTASSEQASAALIAKKQFGIDV
ncbi:MAG TPA: hypothetical protein DD670_04395, partial [Planctomycetaceae bacterium]|nr:hypothetical protein [Planctomycetaceae bacterium]